MIYLVGQTIELTESVRDADGALTDATMALAVTAPDGTASEPTPTRTGTGQYGAAFTADQAGYWQYQWTASGTLSGVNQGQILVLTTGLQIVSLDEAKKHLNKTAATDDNEMLGFIAAASDAADVVLGAVVPRQVVELARGDRKLVLTTRPIMSITTVVDATSGDTLDADDYRQVGSTSILRGPFHRCHDYEVTYLAGRPQPWPLTIRLGALELIKHLWRASQVGAGAARSAPNADDKVVSVPGVAFAMPNRVLELWEGWSAGPVVL